MIAIMHGVISKSLGEVCVINPKLYKQAISAEGGMINCITEY